MLRVSHSSGLQHPEGEEDMNLPVTPVVLASGPRALPCVLLVQLTGSQYVSPLLVLQHKPFCAPCLPGPSLHKQTPIARSVLVTQIQVSKCPRASAGSWLGTHCAQEQHKRWVISSAHRPGACVLVTCCHCLCSQHCQRKCWCFQGTLDW